MTLKQTYLVSSLHPVGKYHLIPIASVGRSWFKHVRDSWRVKKFTDTPVPSHLTWDPSTDIHLGFSL